jgi:hypothetical protein
MVCHFIGLFLNEELVGWFGTQYIDLEMLFFWQRDHCLKQAS